MRYGAAWIAKERTGSPVHLFVYEENIRAQSFYDKLGGQVVERQYVLRNDGQYNYSLRYVWQNLFCLTAPST